MDRCKMCHFSLPKVVIQQKIAELWDLSHYNPHKCAAPFKQKPGFYCISGPGGQTHILPHVWLIDWHILQQVITFPSRLAHSIAHSGMCSHNYKSANHISQREVIPQGWWGPILTAVFMLLSRNRCIVSPSPCWRLIKMRCAPSWRSGEKASELIALETQTLIFQRVHWCFWRGSYSEWLEER